MLRVRRLIDESTSLFANRQGTILPDYSKSMEITSLVLFWCVLVRGRRGKSGGSAGAQKGSSVRLTRQKKEARESISIKSVDIM